MSPRVVLVGPPGSGKTTVAGRLFRLTGLAVRDTDTDVERVAGKPVPAIFAEDGEAVFRELERQAVATALAEHDGVLALGGGAVLAEQTRRALAGHPVVYLSLSMPTGVRRTGLSGNRPLLVGVNPRATYKALLDKRIPVYRQVATVEIQTDELTATQVAERIVAELGLSLKGGS